jgi:hypothetical protein
MGEKNESESGLRDGVAQAAASVSPEQALAWMNEGRPLSQRADAWWPRLLLAIKAAGVKEANASLDAEAVDAVEAVFAEWDAPEARADVERARHAQAEWEAAIGWRDPPPWMPQPPEDGLLDDADEEEEEEDAEEPAGFPLGRMGRALLPPDSEEDPVMANFSRFLVRMEFDAWAANLGAGPAWDKKRDLIDSLARRESLLEAWPFIAMWQFLGEAKAPTGSWAESALQRVDWAAGERAATPASRESIAWRLASCVGRGWRHDWSNAKEALRGWIGGMGEEERALAQGWMLASWGRQSWSGVRVASRGGQAEPGELPLFNATLPPARASLEFMERAGLIDPAGHAEALLEQISPRNPREEWMRAIAAQALCERIEANGGLGERSLGLAKEQAALLAKTREIKPPTPDAAFAWARVAASIAKLERGAILAGVAESGAPAAKARPTRRF